MLLDLHAHTSGISTCCQIPAPEVLKEASHIGLDGIILTNHYTKDYIKGGAVEGFVKKYIEEYHYTKKCGDEMGLKVFFGVEVSMELYPRVHLLIYGVDEKFILEHPTVFDYTQEELYKAVKAHNGALIQAHPFRNGTKVLDVNFLDGLEINCHPKYEHSYAKELSEIAKKSGLILTCGGDYHADTYRPHCGTFLPDTISDISDIGKFLCETNEIKLWIQEPNVMNCIEVKYVKAR